MAQALLFALRHEGPVRPSQRRPSHTVGARLRRAPARRNLALTNHRRGAARCAPSRSPRLLDETRRATVNQSSPLRCFSRTGNHDERRSRRGPSHSNLCDPKQLRFRVSKTRHKSSTPAPHTNPQGNLTLAPRTSILNFIQGISKRIRRHSVSQCLRGDPPPATEDLPRARPARNHAQRTQSLFVKRPRVFVHGHDRPNHAPQFLIAHPQNFLHNHARILPHPGPPRCKFPPKLS